MAGINSTLLEMAGNNWNGWKWLKMATMAGNGLKWMEMDGNGYKLAEKSLYMAENGWK